ncbi:MAG: hypothetical protein QHJ73_01820 [Armatimonadota bacterium]|nr:hypothetical protein [Armatimonadota bacterium]
MMRTHKHLWLGLLWVLAATLPAGAQQLDLNERVEQQVARTAWVLTWQHQRRSSGWSDSASDPLTLATTPNLAPPTRAPQSGLVPFSLQIGQSSRLRFTYGVAGPDQEKRDPVAATVQGMGFTGGFGSVKTESQVYFYNPKLDGGAVATLARDYRQQNPTRSVSAARLQGGRAVKQSLELKSGTLAVRGLYQDIDAGFSPSQRFQASGNDAEAAKRLLELAGQAGTQRTALGLTAGLSKSWSLSGSVDHLDDGKGQFQRREVGVKGKFLTLNVASQDADSAFAGFQRFGDPEVQKLESQRGVRRRSVGWALTPSKEVGLEGTRSTARDAGGEVTTSTLGARLGTFQFARREQSVAGFKTFNSLDAKDQALQKIAGVTLTDTQASVGLGGKTRLAFSESRLSDQGGESRDRLYAFDSRTVVARARFLDVDSDFKSFKGLAEYDKQYAGLDRYKGQRQAIYDLDYVGSSIVGLRNHYERATIGEGDRASVRTNLANTLNLNLGRSTARLYRSVTQTETAAGESSSRTFESYFLRRAVQKEGFVSAQHDVQTDVDAEGKKSILQTDQVQAKLSLGLAGNLEGQRTERRITGAGMDHLDTLTLSRKFGAFNVAYHFNDRQDAKGRGETQRFAVTAAPWRGLAVNATRERRVEQGAPGANNTPPPAVYTQEQRYTATQEVGKRVKLGLSFARTEVNGAMKSGEQAYRLDLNATKSMVVSADFTQRQAAGKPMGVSQGIRITDELKERRWGWNAYYRHRSAAMGLPEETKGWEVRYKGEGKNPLTLTASYLRNPEQPDGKALPARLASAQLSGGLGRRMSFALKFSDALDEVKRTAKQRTELTLSRTSASALEAWTFTAATQRSFEPNGKELKRAREDTLRAEYKIGAGKDQCFTLGGNVTFRTDEANGKSSTRTEFGSDIRWARSF